MKAYKLFRIKKNGAITPLFIGKSQELEIGTLYQAEYLPTKGFKVQPNGGWHCCFQPYAPHLKEQLKSGEIRKWYEVEVDDYTILTRPESLGGDWILAQKMTILGEV